MSDTKLLLHCNGADGSKVFIDSATGRTITATADAQQDTARYKFGTASALFDGAGDAISTDSSADFNFNASQFCIDLWWNSASINGKEHALFGHNIDHGGIVLRYNNATGSGKYALNLSGNGSTWNIANDQHSSDPGLINDTWYHVALTWDGANYRLFNNGSVILTIASAVGLYNANGILEFGGSLSSNYLQGWIDEVRVVKGSAIWTSNFTVPVRAYGSAGNKGIIVY